MPNFSIIPKGVAPVSLVSTLYPPLGGKTKFTTITPRPPITTPKHSQLLSSVYIYPRLWRKRLDEFGI